MKKNKSWGIIDHSGRCGHKTPYGDYTSCQHWKHQKKLGEGSPVECSEKVCPIHIYTACEELWGEDGK